MRIFLGMAALLGLLLCAPVAQAEGVNNGPQELKAQPPTPMEVVELFHQSLREGDTDQVLAQLAPDVIIYETGFAERSRDQYANGHVQEDETFASGTQRKITRRESWEDDNAAWVLTQSEIRGEFGERKIALEQTETMLLRKSAGGWRITHIHWSAHTPSAQ